MQFQGAELNVAEKGDSLMWSKVNVPVHSTEKTFN
jgi:hypothetical protein